ELLFDVIAPVRFARQRNAAQRKIDPGGEAHRRDHDAELASLGQWFDNAGARAVTKAAVMIRNAIFQHFGQVLASEELLLVTELERIWCGQLTRQLGGEGLSSLTARGENQNGPQILGQRLGHKTRPVTATLAR